MKKPIQKLLAVAFVMSAQVASADVPRTLASGAPACGNTGGKGPSMCQTAETELQDAKLELANALAVETGALAALVDSPRTLANGAPACGNTGGKKMKPCTVEVADRTYDQRIQRLVRASVQIGKARARIVEAEKQWRTYGAASVIAQKD